MAIAGDRQGEVVRLDGKAADWMSVEDAYPLACQIIAGLVRSVRVQGLLGDVRIMKPGVELELLDWSAENDTVIGWAEAEVDERERNKGQPIEWPIPSGWHAFQDVARDGIRRISAEANPDPDQ